jgi:hypothetical protein
MLYAENGGNLSEHVPMCVCGKSQQKRKQLLAVVVAISRWGPGMDEYFSLLCFSVSSTLTTFSPAIWGV